MSRDWRHGRCSRGHDVTDPENVSVSGRDGRRVCRICHRLRGRANPKPLCTICVHCGVSKKPNKYRWCSVVCEERYREERGLVVVPKKRQKQNRDAAPPSASFGRALDLLCDAETLPCWQRIEMRQQAQAIMRREAQ